MARLEPKVLLKRSKRAWNDKEQYRQIMTDALALTQPEKNTLIMRSKGQLLNDKIYANTLQRSHFNFANRLQSELTPPLQKWMELTPGPRVPKDMKQGIQRRLSDLREIFFAMVQGSNFDTAAHEHYLELGLMNGATLVQPSEDPSLDIQYITPPQTDYALESGAWGKTIGVFRKFTIKAMDIKMYWGDAFEGKDTQTPEGWDRKNLADPDRKIQLEEITYWGFPEDAREWYYDVIFRDAENRVIRVVARDFPENPWVISRWSRSPGECYGRGPVLLALADAKVQNIVYKLLLMNASLAIKGVYTGVDDGVFNPRTVQFLPGAIIPVGSNSSSGQTGRSLEPLAPAYDLDLSAFILDDLDLRIRKAMLDEGLPPDTGAVRSATEIMERTKQLRQVSESPFARLHQEWIRPITQVSLNVALRKGISGFEDLQNGIRIDGQIIDVKMISSMAQGQQLSELDSFVRMVELSNALFGPDITADGVKTEDTTRFMADRLGVDPYLIRDAKEQQLRQAQRMIEQQRLQFEELKKNKGNVLSEVSAAA